MKKKLFGFVLAFAFLITGAICLTACGDPEVYEVKVEVQTGTTNYVTLRDDQQNLNSDSFQVEEGKNFTKSVMLMANYDPDTLKFYNNGAEVAWTKDETLDENAYIDDQLVKVGTLSINSVQGDITLKYEAEEKEISFTLTRASTDTEELTPEKIGMLKEFKLATDQEKNLYDMISEGYQIKTTYSQRSTPIIFVCEKQIGYYYTDELCFGFSPNPAASRNAFSLTLPNNSNLQKENELAFKFDQFNLSTIGINDNCGGMYMTVDCDHDPSMLANQSKQITLTLLAADGADSSNVSVYINGTKVGNANASTPYTIDLTGKLPIDYMQGNLSEMQSTAFTFFDITATGLEITDPTKFCMVDTSTESTELECEIGSIYYKDQSQNIAYCTEDIFVGIHPNTSSNVTISNGENTCTVSFTEIFEHSQESTDVEWLNNMFTTNEGLVTSISAFIDENWIRLGFKCVTGTTYNFSLS